MKISDKALNDPRAEQVILSALWMYEENWHKYSQYIKEEYFTDSRLRIYRAMSDIAGQAKPINAASLIKKISNSDFIELGMYEPCILSDAGILTTCSELHDYAIRREMIASGKAIQSAAKDLKEPVDISGVINKLTDLSSLDIAAAQTIAQVSGAAFNDLDHIEADRLANYHIRELNKLTNGFGKGDLIVIAGRTGMGKTSFVLNLCEHIASCGKSVLIASLEMSNEQLAHRIMSKFSGVSVNSIHFKEHRTKIQEATEKIVDSKFAKTLHVIDRAFSIAQIRSLAKTKLYDVIAIDYLQLMSIKGNYKNRELEVAQMSRELKRIAKDCGIVIFLLAQLNRQVESRADKRPQLSDLRESGAIEQDADAVLMLYRPEYYNIAADDNGDATHGQCFVLVVKNRHGATGEAEAYFVDGQIIDKPLDQSAPF